MKQRKVLFLITWIIFVTIVLSASATDAKTYSGSKTISRGGYIAVSQDVEKDEEISWSFTSSNQYVGIYVFAMTETNFNNFERGNYASTYVYTLSNGNYIRDEGTFEAKSDTTWYIVFWHFEEQTASSTTVTYNVEFPSTFPTLIVVLLIVGVVALVVFLIIKNSTKQRSSYPSTYPPTNSYHQQMPTSANQPHQPPSANQPHQPPSANQPHQQSPFEKVIETPVEVRYCTNCGSVMRKIFCPDCGTKRE